VVIGTPVFAIPLAVALLPQLGIFAILLSLAVYSRLAGRVMDLPPPAASARSATESGCLGKLSAPLL
jgi:hypothetical protein